jgi:hypothetical protein
VLKISLCYLTLSLRTVETLDPPAIIQTKIQIKDIPLSVLGSLEQHTKSMSRSRKSSRDLTRRSSSSSSSYAQHNNKKQQQQDSDSDEQPTVVFRCSLHNTIFDVMRSRPGWQETDSDTDWDFNWADVGWVREYFDHTHLEEHQRINHFRNHYELTRKDLLVKNLKRMKRQLERTDTHAEANKYSFFPATFVLPAEYGLFVEEFKRTPGVTWIMKPVGRAQGKGIFLFNRLSQVSDWKKDYKWKSDQPQADSYVAQRYIESPLLVGGRKFDMRLYVLVTSYTPLKAWVHRGGFCRFTAGTNNIRSGGAVGVCPQALIWCCDVFLMFCFLFLFLFCSPIRQRRFVRFE